MNPTLITGTVIVTLALICYSIAVITEQRKKMLSAFIMTFLTIGIVLDVTATIFMISGSSNMPFTPHGVLGYSALLVMLIDTILNWQHWRKNGSRQAVPDKLHRYTRAAYTWWVIAYIVGGMMAAL